jgi:hypothetical protein
MNGGEVYETLRGRTQLRLGQARHRVAESSCAHRKADLGQLRRGLNGRSQDVGARRRRGPTRARGWRHARGLWRLAQALGLRRRAPTARSALGRPGAGLARLGYGGAERPCSPRTRRLRGGGGVWRPLGGGDVRRPLGGGDVRRPLGGGDVRRPRARGRPGRFCGSAPGTSSFRTLTCVLRTPSGSVLTQTAGSRLRDTAGGRLRDTAASRLRDSAGALARRPVRALLAAAVGTSAGQCAEDLGGAFVAHRLHMIAHRADQRPARAAQMRRGPRRRGYIRTWLDALDRGIRIGSAWFETTGAEISTCKSRRNGAAYAAAATPPPGQREGLDFTKYSSYTSWVCLTSGGAPRKASLRYCSSAQAGLQMPVRATKTGFLRCQ